MSLKQDRKKNAHLVLFGPTGAGKSAVCAHKLMLGMAVHRPRLFLLEVGGSFTLPGEHFRRHGLSVNQVTLSANSDISLPPFADACHRALSAPRDAAAGRARRRTGPCPDAPDPADLLGAVTVGRDREAGEVFAQLEKPAERLLLAAVGESLGVVAGAGFEPTTFGL